MKVYAAIITQMWYVLLKQMLYFPFNLALSLICSLSSQIKMFMLHHVAVHFFAVRLHPGVILALVAVKQKHSPPYFKEIQVSAVKYMFSCHNKGNLPANCNNHFV